MTDSDPAAQPPTPPPAPPPAAPPTQPPVAPPVPPPSGAAPAAPRPATAAAAKPAAGMNVTGSDSLILAGAALYLVGELLFGDLLGGGSSSSLFLGNGLTLAGVLAGLVLFFLYFVGPRGGRQGLISAKTLQVIVAALVVGITLYALSDFLATLRNLGSIPDLGIFGILQQLCRWAGAVLMALGVSAAWAPITTPTPTTPTPPAAKT